MNIDSTELHIGRSNRKVELVWHILKNNIRVENRDSIFLPIHDTAFYEILY